MLRVLLLGVLFVIIARAFWRTVDGVIAGVTGKPSGGRQSRGPKPTKLVRDPVCGTFVVPDAALALTRGDTVYHFCSAGCRAKFTGR